jgi:hypothetical protein
MKNGEASKRLMDYIEKNYKVFKKFIGLFEKRK